MISCTNAGRLRLTQANVDAEDDAGNPHTTFIPNRLCEWVLSEDSQSFAYGGDEVEVSVWDTSRALNPSRRLLPSSAVGTKRKKGKTSELFDGEIWRAQNVR
jgi:ribosome biogenesis protein NSA1